MTHAELDIRAPISHLQFFHKPCFAEYSFRDSPSQHEPESFSTVEVNGSQQSIVASDDEPESL